MNVISLLAIENEAVKPLPMAFAVCNLAKRSRMAEGSKGGDWIAASIPDGHMWSHAAARPFSLPSPRAGERMDSRRSVQAVPKPQFDINGGVVHFDRQSFPLLSESKLHEVCFAKWAKWAQSGRREVRLVSLCQHSTLLSHPLYVQGAVNGGW